MTRPWRGWSFAYAALAVPTHSRLKTSGMALRKADWLFKGTVVDPREVQLLFVPQDEPYTFTHSIDRRQLTTTVTPNYRFIWQVRGVIESLTRRIHDHRVAIDYQTGRMLYDVRDDLRPSELSQPPEPSEPAPAP